MAAVLTTAGLLVLPAHTYVFNYTVPSTGGDPQLDHWDFTAFPVVWNLNPSSGTNISGSRSITQVMEASFATWESAPNAAINASRGTDSALTALDNSGTNLICFTCSHSNFSDASTLALTITFVADRTGLSDFHGGTSKFVGQMLKAAIFFNPNVAFSTDGSSSSAQDLQAVATHEIGHFFGLNHSAVVRAVMYRAASDIHTLGYDDVAALSVLYPPACQAVATGSITGTVSRSSSAAVFGAHVFAESLSASQPFSATIRKTPIGALTRPDGSYRIDGVPPDSYVVLAEPMDGPVTNADFGTGSSGYAGTFGKTAVETDFNTRWH
jgi:Matrixin